MPYHQFFDRFLWSENADIQQMKATLVERVQAGDERLSALPIQAHYYLAPLGEFIPETYRYFFHLKAFLYQRVEDHFRRQADQEAWWGDFTREDWFGVKDFARKGAFSLLASGFQLSVHTNQWLQNQVAQPLVSMAQDFHNRPYSALLIEHVNTLNAFLPQIAYIISTHLIHNLEGLLEPAYAYDSLHDTLRDEVQNRFFKDQSYLPGIELSNIGMTHSGYEIIFSRMGDDRNITNGEALGTAMSVLAERLRGLATFEGIEDEEDKENELLFSLLNKSLSLLGLRTLEKTEDVYVETHPVSFFRPLYREQDQSRKDNLRAWNYLQNKGLWQQQTSYGECLDDIDAGQDVQQGYFAIPDHLVLGEPFSIDMDQSQDGLATVASQAELIRGAARLLKYLSAKQGDLEGLDLSYEGIYLFPSVSLFHIHLALVTVNLHNLLRGGVTLYDGDRNPTYVRVDTDLPEYFQWASVHDVKEGDETFYWTNTTDLAKLIIAIEEFISMAEGLEDLQNLPDIACMERVNYQQIKDNLPILSEFSLALSAYMMTFLQADDGGFVDHYTMGMGLENASFSLRTQILAMHALITSYRRVKRAEMKTSVLQSFRYTTENLFDSNSGFYVDVRLDGSEESPDFLLTTDILRLLYKMDALLENESIYVRNDLRNLRTRWVSSFARQLTPFKTALPTFTF